MTGQLPNNTIPATVRSVDDSFPHRPVERPPDALPTSRWVSYMRSAGAPRNTLSPSQREIADAIFSEYQEKVALRRAEEEEALLRENSIKKSKKARGEAIGRRVHRKLMRSPWAPLFFRLFILVDSVIALALALDIFVNNKGCEDNSTHILAIVVNAIAIPYTLYIAWDEFFSRPIGLRRSRSKLRLLTLDLVFIIFDSANLSLAFDAGTDIPNDAQDRRCHEQWGLVSVLLIALVAWVSTFLLSLFRLNYKLEGGY